MTHPQNVEYVTTVGHTVGALTITLQNNGSALGLSTAERVEMRLVNVHDGVTYYIDLTPSITNAADGTIVHEWDAWPHPGVYRVQYVIDYETGVRAFVPDAGVPGRDFYLFVFLPPVAPDPAPEP